MHDVVVVKVMNDVEGQCGRGCHCSKGHTFLEKFEMLSKYLCDKHILWIEYFVRYLSTTNNLYNQEAKSTVLQKASELFMEYGTVVTLEWNI